MDVVSASSEDSAALWSFFQRVSSTNWSESLLAQSLSNQRSLLAKQKGVIVGYCIAQQTLDELCIEDIAVDPHFMRQGIAKKLMQHLFTEALQQGVSSIFLEVRRSNKAAIQLYKSVDFQRVGIRKSYYPSSEHLPKEDAIVMQRLV